MITSKTHNDRVKQKFDDTTAYVKGNSTIAARLKICKSMLNNIVYNSILDAGCGDGSIGVGLVNNNCELLLMDLSEKMLERASQNAKNAGLSNFSTQTGDACTFNAGRKFDLIVCLGVLAHVPSVEDVISMVSNHLEPNGHAIIQFTESNSLQGKIAYQWFKKASPLYEVRTTGSDLLTPIFNANNLDVVVRKRYSESSLGMGKLGINFATNFKVASAKLGPISNLFSGSLMLLKKK